MFLSTISQLLKEGETISVFRTHADDPLLNCTRNGTMKLPPDPREDRAILRWVQEYGHSLKFRPLSNGGIEITKSRLLEEDGLVDRRRFTGGTLEQAMRAARL